MSAVIATSLVTEATRIGVSRVKGRVCRLPPTVSRPDPWACSSTTRPAPSRAITPTPMTVSGRAGSARAESSPVSVPARAALPIQGRSAAAAIRLRRSGRMAQGRPTTASTEPAVTG